MFESPQLESVLDIDQFLDFFVEDAVVHGVVEIFGQQGPMVGHEQLRGFFGAAFENLDWLIQLNSITDVSLSPDGMAANTSLAVVETAERTGADQILMIGRYDDKLTLTDRGWKFVERRLTVHKFTTFTLTDPRPG